MSPLHILADARGHLGAENCIEKVACLSPAYDRHLIGEFLKIERAKDAAVSCVEETKKAPDRR
jgi:hypothetical protein